MEIEFPFVFNDEIFTENSTILKNDAGAGKLTTRNEKKLEGKEEEFQHVIIKIEEIYRKVKSLQRRLGVDCINFKVNCNNNHIMTKENYKDIFKKYTTPFVQVVERPVDQM